MLPLLIALLMMHALIGRAVAQGSPQVAGGGSNGRVTSGGSQWQEPRATLYLEMGGNAAATSVNADVVMRKHYFTRFGLGFNYRMPYEFETLVCDGEFVAMAGYLFGGEASSLEMGIGTVVDMSTHYRNAILDGNNSRFKPTGTLALRFQSMVPGAMIRLAYTPFFDATHWRNWWGFSVGFSLSRGR